MLWKKTWRDIKENKGAYIACIIIIIIGLMVFSAFSMVIGNLKLSQKNFYSNQNFADGFIKVRSMPMSEVKKLQNINGIKSIEGRLVKDARVLFPNRDENVYLRLVSLPSTQNFSPINGVDLLQGIPLNSKEMNVWVDNKFYDANKIEINQQIDVIAQGAKKSLRVVGYGRSPEFIYALRTSSDLFPNPETFGIAFLPYDVMKALFSYQEVANNVVFTLEPGASYKDVEELLKPKLKTYGLEAIYPRKDQVSHMLLSEELKGLEAAAKGMPILFLSIAGVILYIMLKRMVEQQRGQIGILKAFGYTEREVLGHYLSYAFVLGVAGGLLGGLSGIALSYPFTSMYQLFFNMPGLNGQFSPRYLLLGLLLSIIFSLFAGYQGSKKILTLEPAEAMRPPAPPIGRKIWLEKIGVFWNILTAQGKMAVRNMARNKGRSAFIFVGIMFTFAILAYTWSMNDLVKVMLFDQYQKVETYDVKVTLAAPSNQKSAKGELYNFPGVKRVEPMAEIPATLKNKWLKKDVAIIGIQEDSTLYNILDNEYNKVTPPTNGLLLSERLARLLNTHVGSRLYVSDRMSQDEDNKELEVVGIIPQYLGVSAYMEIGALQKFLGYKGLTTSYLVSINPENISALQNKYRESAVVAGVDDLGKRLQQSQELMASFGSMIYIYALIGIIIGFAIIYNSSIITLSERSHELASMRVLGMTPREVLSVITFEQWFIGVLGMIGGIPLSKAFLVGISQSMSNDLYTMPTDLTSSSFVMAFLVTALSIWIAQQMAAQKIKRLNLADTLKARE